ncbi:MAG: thymidylate kinase [Planctomycetota bacterium]|nr:thymidylate kinase [Planctomycetota bacterium]
MSGQGSRAVLIDFEGIDGSGKGTQARRLCERLAAERVSCALISFPRYGETLFGKAVGEFLNGRFGALDQVHPFLVSLLFAGDRFESKGLLEQALLNNQVVVLDRYVPSNIAHQASKCPEGERGELVERILKIEHELYGMPRADLVLLLDLPVERAQELIALKAKRDYTDRAADIQEADARYLSNVREVYHGLARSEPGWRRIDCATSERLLSIDEVHAAIWNAVAPRLPTLARSVPS